MIQKEDLYRNLHGMNLKQKYNVFWFPISSFSIKSILFCTLIFFECTHTKVMHSYKSSANFLFTPSSFFAFSLYNTIQNLTKPILLSVLPKNIDIHYSWQSQFQCAQNYLQMLCALSKMRCKEGAHGGEGCGIQQCKAVNLGGAKPKLLIGVDGYIVCCHIVAS